MTRQKRYSQSITKGIAKYISDANKKGYIELPDEVPLRIMQLNLAPSYKEICLKILQNSFNKMPQSQSRAYFELKRIELTDKGKIKKSNQLKLKL